MVTILFKTGRKNWLPYFIYALLSLTILGALLRPGYILTLDGPFTPRINIGLQFFGLNNGLSVTSVPIWSVLQPLSQIIPGWFLQKGIFLALFFLAGVGAHRLLGSRGAGNYFAGIFYMVTPFVYVRFLAGQMGVLWAYALTPFAIKAFIELLKDVNLKNVLKVAIFSTLTGILQLQGSLLLLLVFIVMLLAYSVQVRKTPDKIITAFKYAGLAGGSFIILNLYWLIPTLKAGASMLGQVSSQDEFLFAPNSGGSGRVMFDTAAMYGFWRGGYVYVKDILPFWWVLFIVILFLAVYGLISRMIPTSAYSKNYDSKLTEYNPQSSYSDFVGTNWVAISFGIIWFLSLILAIGAAAPQTKPAFDWLWNHFSLLRGFRDSQKFVALICLAYAFLGALGVYEFVRIFKRVRGKLPRYGLASLVVIALITPLLYSFTIFNFHGQLGATNYPSDWYTANNYLDQDKSDFNVLVLPWHQYMDFSWVRNQDKRLNNPAQQFFDKPAIQGDNLEMPGIYSESTNPISKYVEFLLANQKNIDNLGELLAPLNVKYVILLHEADFTSYDFVSHQSDLKSVLNLTDLTVFENQHSLARVYSTDSVVHIQSLDDYLKLSQTQDVMAHVYVLGNGPDSAQGNGELQPVGVVEKNPVDYRVDGTPQKYVVFTVPQEVNNEEWKLNGHDPVLQNLGFMPVFASSGPGDIVYTRFYNVYLPAYIVSGVALLGTVGFFVIRTVRKKKGET